MYKMNILIKTTTLLSLLVASTCPAGDAAEFQEVRIPNAEPQGFIWPSTIPDDCPFEQSDLFNRVYFTGRYSDYMCGDTFYPSWAADGNLYSPWTDGTTDGMTSGSWRGKNAHTGHAIMVGDDPLNLMIKNTSPPKHASSIPYQGRYPAGSLVYNGVWYYSTYCLGPDGGYKHNDFVFNWPNLGPMPGFQISYDLGKTWVPSPHTPETPLFPEPEEVYAPVKMGAPHFVDFGKNMEHSPDGKAYLLGMGAVQDDPMPRPCIVKGAAGQSYQIGTQCPGDDIEHFAHANLSWITADQIYLARVVPSPETINDENAYEYFAGHKSTGEPVWSDDFKRIKPLIEWNNNMGCVTATYVPSLKKYLMCITDGWPTVAKMDSYFLEADQLTGPWKIITYMKDFGEQAYFLNVPSKFIAENGRDMWLCYSANFSPGWNGCKLNFNPEGGRYGLCLHEMRFLSAADKDPVAPRGKKVDFFAGNRAREARVTVSSTYEGYSPQALIDATVKAPPGAPNVEWASNGEKSGAWVKLEWTNPQKVSRVQLFDRSNEKDQVLAGRLVFSDGTTVDVNEPLHNLAQTGLEIHFVEKTITWVKFEVSKTGDKTMNIGLAELAVF